MFFNILCNGFNAFSTFIIKRNTGINNSFPALFEDFFTKDFFDSAPSKSFSNFAKTTPAVNIIENEQAFRIEVAVPGLKKEDFKVEVEDGLLTISFEKAEQAENKDYKKENGL
mgnify:CR=1 FL=1